MIEKVVANYVNRESKKLLSWIEDKRVKYPLSEEIKISRDIPYDNSKDTSHTFDIFELKDRKESLPVIINVHGGGLVYGYKAQNDWFCAELAKRGFLVFSIEYPTIPDVDIFGIYKCVTNAFNYINDRLMEYGGDKDNVCWTGDSAGAFIITNMAAIKNNENIRNAAGVERIELSCKALGLMSGMFYTTKPDKISILRGTIYGKDYKTHPFFKYISPDNEEFVKALPPCFLVTSACDMLRKHTIALGSTLKANRKVCLLSDYVRDKKLVHAFVTLYPEYEESQMAIEDMLTFFGTVR